MQHQNVKEKNHYIKLEHFNYCPSSTAYHFCVLREAT